MLVSNQIAVNKVLRSPDRVLNKQPGLRLKTLSTDTVSFSGKTGVINIDKIVAGLEKKIKDQPVENAYIVDSKTGKILEESKGSKGEIFLNEKLVQGNVFTHNHPESRTPVTLSESDIIFGIENRAKEIRAITPSGTWYSFKLPDDLSIKDANILSDIFLECLFSCQDYLAIRDLIKINSEGEYLNSKEELQFISENVSFFWGHIADLMKENGYKVEYKTGSL